MALEVELGRPGLATPDLPPRVGLANHGVESGLVDIRKLPPVALAQGGERFLGLAIEPLLRPGVETGVSVERAGEPRPGLEETGALHEQGTSWYGRAWAS